MEIVHTVQDAFGCDGGIVAGGWFAVVESADDFDVEYLEDFGRHTVTFREGKTEADWSNTFASAPRRLVLVSKIDGVYLEQPLAEAGRIRGFAATSGPEPAAAWTEPRDGAWRLILWSPEGAETVLESRGILRAPSLAWAGEGAVVACEYEEGGQDRVGVWTASGKKVLTKEGRRPKLAGSPDGRAFLAVERKLGPAEVGLFACEIKNGGCSDEIALPRAGDLNFNADVAWDPHDGALFVVCESCAAWGHDERVGLHRDLSLWTLAGGGRSFEPGPGTCSGRLPLMYEAFFDGSMHNFTPIQPRILFLKGRPAVAFRRFRFTGNKCYGWDTFLTQRLADGAWADAARVSPNAGHADAGYAVLAEDWSLIGLFPCCDQRSKLTFAEEAAGEPGSGRTGSARNHRVEVVRFVAGESLPRIEIPRGKEAAYVIPPSIYAVGPEPPALQAPPDGLTLIWGDLHAHTAYSKCMSANDGLPEDVLRFGRDVLGCRVLCLTEHVEYMTNPEFTHVLDCVAAEAGDGCVPFYGVEWAKRPANHTNFYAIDRNVFDRLRGLMLACDHLTPLYKRIKEELPPGSVVAIRHMHGMTQDEFGVNGTRVTETHDPEIEWAMEAMQTRGNMMVTAHKYCPLFPNNFLNAGAKLGLVGGSDHSRGRGPNRFCLTGFWVEEVTPQAVWRAIRNRRTIAMSNGKVAIYATLDGKPMGEPVTVSGPVRIEARFAAAKTIQRVCLMRDGELLDWQDVGANVAALQLTDEGASPGGHWYAVTAEADSGPVRPPILAHASPFFVEVRE